MKKIKNMIILSFSFLLSNSSFSWLEIGQNLNIHSNAIPAGAGSLSEGIDVFLINSNLVALGQNGYFSQVEDYFKTNDIYVIDGDWYIERRINGFSLEIAIGPTADYTTPDQPLLLSDPIASFSPSLASITDGLSMTLNPNWQSTNSVFTGESILDYFVFYPDASGFATFSDNIYFNDFDSMHTSTNEWDDREVEIAYDGIIPTRDSVIEFGLINESHRSLNNGDWFDIGLDISGEGTSSNEYQEIAVYLKSEHFEAGEIGDPIPPAYTDVWLEYDIWNGSNINGALSTNFFGGKIERADFRHYYSNNTFTVDFRPTAVYQEGEIVSTPNAPYINLLKFPTEIYFNGMHYDQVMLGLVESNANFYADANMGTTNINGYYYNVVNLEGLSLSGWNTNNISPWINAEFEATAGIENDAVNPPINSLGISHLNVYKSDDHQTLTAVDLGDTTINLPTDFRPDNDGDLFNSDLFIWYDEEDQNLVVEGAGGVFYSGNILGNISTSYPGWESQAGDYTNQYSTLTTGVIHQIRSGSLSRGELGEIDAVLTGILDEYHGIVDDPETTSLTKLDLLYSNGSLIKQYNYEAIYDGDDFVGSLYAILSDDNISLVDSFVATDYISSTSSNLLFNIAPSIASYPSNYVYRIPEPTSLSAISLDWELDLTSLPNYPTNIGNQYNTMMMDYNDWEHIEIFQKLNNGKIVVIYPHLDSRDVTNTAVSVISSDGSLSYNTTLSYVPFYEQDQYGNPRIDEALISVVALDNGMFGIEKKFNRNDGAMQEYTDTITAYSALLYPTNTTYEIIFFNNKLLSLEEDKSEKWNDRSKKGHKNAYYTFNSEKTILSRYSINLPHLNTVDVSNTEEALSALDDKINLVSSNLTQTANSLALSDTSIQSGIESNSSSVSNALIAYTENAIIAFSNSVDWASIGSGGPDPLIDNRVSDVESVNALLANSINLEIAQRQAAVSALQDDIINLQTAMGTMTNNSAGMTIAEAKEMMKDLRPGSTIIDVEGGQATISMHLEESSDLTTNWTQRADTLMEVTVPATNNIQFFRFGN